MIKQKTALFGTENLSAYLRKMAIGGSIINLDMPERDADNGSWVAGTPAAYFSQESKDAVERLLCDRDTNPLKALFFSATLMNWISAHDGVAG